MELASGLVGPVPELPDAFRPAVGGQTAPAELVFAAACHVVAPV